MNFNCGLSDVHNLIAFQLKIEVPLNKSKWCTYRSFKNFDVDNFNEDLISSLTKMIFSDSCNVNNMYETFTGKILSVANKHAPLKKKKCITNSVPSMNKSLKQEIYRNRMLYSQYQKHRTLKNWEKFRLQRNLVNKLKRKSVNQYFVERCVGGCKSKDFWPTVKPFLTNKGSHVQKDTILHENGKPINDQQEVCNIFNNFFVNEAKDIGQNSFLVNSDHPSVIKIEENLSGSGTLNFQPVNKEFISKQIDKLSMKKATGHDGISAKILRLAKPAVVEPVTKMISVSTKTSEILMTVRKLWSLPFTRRIVLWIRKTIAL